VFSGEVEGNGKIMRFAPQLSGIRELDQEEAVKLRREIEERFVQTGILVEVESAKSGANICPTFGSRALLFGQFLPKLPP
jgi:hypothetical protein